MAKYELNAEVVYRENLTDELFVLCVRPLDAQIPDFTPGQYVELAMPDKAQLSGETKLIRRAYSIASAPSNSEHIELYIVVVPDGYLTPKLWTLELGDKLWMGPKIKGKFTLDPIPPGKDLVVVSTGTGNAPFVSMLREFRNTNRWNRFVFIHGVRYEKDLGYREELEQVSAEDDSVIYIPTVTREPQDSSWEGLRGRVPVVFQGNTYEQYVGAPLDPKDSHIMLCGNPAMIDSMEELLKERGFKEHKKKDPGNIHLERYW